MPKEEATWGSHRQAPQTKMYPSLQEILTTTTVFTSGTSKEAAHFPATLVSTQSFQLTTEKKFKI